MSIITKTFFHKCRHTDYVMIQCYYSLWALVDGIICMSGVLKTASKTDRCFWDNPIISDRVLRDKCTRSSLICRCGQGCCCSCLAARVVRTGSLKSVSLVTTTFTNPFNTNAMKNHQKEVLNNSSRPAHM